MSSSSGARGRRGGGTKSGSTAVHDEDTRGRHSSRSKEEQAGRAPIPLELGGIRLVYDDGVWTTEKMPENVSEVDVKKLTHDNRRLQEENNLLKYKIEVLIDMLTEARIEAEDIEERLDHESTNGHHGNNHSSRR
ncbi:uncharacterized protein MONBRDRAFT_36725 [Monosiga brevicollis MX1]|uniref:Uncharacterized protein n=1 Tax=Monosiga brevicollis TaxID=81824 RepID=A9UX34_MONBE|nr:uncharacterized protein MONBRDRAFT_36725 [Monosiga brevicollis MX1]EDQ90145.1 predicted protein [Monosiga brevicollis MX1]|eukprot:XP_001744912.1 hypothetical protein [Monosiga brevicollis MX1]